MMSGPHGEDISWSWAGDWATLLAYKANDAGQFRNTILRKPALRRAVPIGCRHRARGARAPAHLAPVPGRDGQDQHLDTGKGPLRAPAVHARHHDQARAGARRVAAQAQRGSRARGGGRHHPGARRARLLLAALGVLHRGKLPDLTSVLWRPERPLCLPDGNLLGCRHVEPDLPEVRAAGRQVRAAGCWSPSPTSPATST